MNLRIGLHFPRSELLSVLEIRLDFALATLNQIMTVDQVERKGKKMKLYLRYHYCCCSIIMCTLLVLMNYIFISKFCLSTTIAIKKGIFVGENFQRVVFTI